ncbi:MAG: sulfatase family protein, partial [Candidatus Eiseniibacteriota bacterium]
MPIDPRRGMPWPRSGAVPLAAGALCLAAWPAAAAPQNESADSPAGVVVFVADDWSAAVAGAYGDPRVRTPSLDRLARAGVQFRYAFCASPICAPSRASLLTGRPPHALGEAANQWGAFPDSVATYPEMLVAAGWAVGHSGKGWAPGRLSPGASDPAGPEVADLESLLTGVGDSPFHYWHGTRRPHRPFGRGGTPRQSGAAPGFRPPHLPDAAAILDDLADYAGEVEEVDRELGALVRQLGARGLAGHVPIIVTSDNGMPFPRAKADVYDAGTHVPLVFGTAAPAGRRIAGAPVELTDLAPTLLELAGLASPPGTTGRSLLPLLRGEGDPARDAVFLERERHARARPGDLGYPVRAVRTADHLYVWNLRAARAPAGDPGFPAGTEGFADVDPSPTKTWLLSAGGDPRRDGAFALALGARPAEELYDLATDPGQLVNLAGDPSFDPVRSALRARLAQWMRVTGDPMVVEPEARSGENAPDPWDRAPYRGPRDPAALAPEDR